MTHRMGWARLAALWQRFVLFCRGKRVPVQVMNKEQILIQLVLAARSRRNGR